MKRFAKYHSQSVVMFSIIVLFGLLISYSKVGRFLMDNHAIADEKPFDETAKDHTQPDDLAEEVPNPIKDDTPKTDRTAIRLPSAAESLVGRAQIESIKGLQHTYRITNVNVTNRDVAMVTGSPKKNGRQVFALEPGVSLISINKGHREGLYGTMSLGSNWKDSIILKPGQRTEFTAMFEVDRELLKRLPQTSIKAVHIECFDFKPANVSGDLFFPIWEP